MIVDVRRQRPRIRTVYDLAGHDYRGVSSPAVGVCGRIEGLLMINSIERWQLAKLNLPTGI